VTLKSRCVFLKSCLSCLGPPLRSVNEKEMSHSRYAHSIPRKFERIQNEYFDGKEAFLVIPMPCSSTEHYQLLFLTKKDDMAGESQVPSLAQCAF
jgi:hypothetical protein